MRIALSVVTVVALAALAYITLSDAKAVTKPEVEEIVKEYIMKNPDVIILSLNNMQENEIKKKAEKAKEAIKENEGKIVSADDPFVGNPDGDVVVAEFFDYNCGYCKRMIPVINEVLAKDKNVRFVFKEFPILSPASELAAEAALAVNRIDPKKYFEFHQALMKTGGYTEENLLKIAGSLGIDKEKLKTEMKSDAVRNIIKKNHEIADTLSIRGTPAMIVGDELLPGAVGADTLLKKIEAARANQ